MQPPLDPDAGSLLRQWIEKADADLEVALRMAVEAADNVRIREIVDFHCQQAAEKYLKAPLTRYQIEFPKTPRHQKVVEPGRGREWPRRGLLERREMVDSVRCGDSLSQRCFRDAAGR